MKQALKQQLDKVIDVHKLTKVYKDVENKRILAGRFDLFVYDRTIDPTIFADNLGKAFMSKKKNPIPIAVRTVPETLRYIENVKSSAIYYKSGGATTNIKVANLDQTDAEIVENVHALLKAMKKQFNPLHVHSISLKTPDSIALPIYTSLYIPNEPPKAVKVRPPASAVPIEAETPGFARRLFAGSQNPKQLKLH